MTRRPHDGAASSRSLKKHGNDRLVRIIKNALSQKLPSQAFHQPMPTMLRSPPRLGPTDFLRRPNHETAPGHRTRKSCGGNLLVLGREDRCDDTRRNSRRRSHDVDGPRPPRRAGHLHHHFDYCGCGCGSLGIGCFGGSTILLLAVIGTLALWHRTRLRRRHHRVHGGTGNGRSGLLRLSCCRNVRSL